MAGPQHPALVKAKERTQQYKKSLDDYLRKDTFLAPYLATMEKKTGVSRVYIFVGAVSVLLIYLLFGSYAGFLSHLITLVYPALETLRALESLNKDDDRKWLTYWLIFGMLGTMEFFTETVLQYLPFYHLVKTAFQIWMFAPTPNNGSEVLYEKLLHPLAVRLGFSNVGSRLGAKIDQTKREVGNKIRDTETHVRDAVNDFKNQ